MLARVSTYEPAVMTTIPTVNRACPAGHTLVSGSMRACELAPDAVTVDRTDMPRWTIRPRPTTMATRTCKSSTCIIWSSSASVDAPQGAGATQLHAGANVPTPYGGTYRVLSNGASPYLRLEFDVTGFEPAAYLVEFSLSTQLHAGADVPTPYGGAYRVLSNGASPYLRIEFDVTGFEPAAYLVAQNVYPGLRSEIDPLPLANVHDENTTYVAAVHLRPGYARTIHAVRGRSGRDW